jgi:hypothetical protein
MALQYSRTALLAGGRSTSGTAATTKSSGEVVAWAACCDSNVLAALVALGQPSSQEGGSHVGLQVQRILPGKIPFVLWLYLHHQALDPTALPLYKLPVVQSYMTYPCSAALQLPYPSTSHAFFNVLPALFQSCLSLHTLSYLLAGSPMTPMLSSPATRCMAQSANASQACSTGKLSPGGRQSLQSRTLLRSWCISLGTKERSPAMLRRLVLCRSHAATTRQPRGNVFIKGSAVNFTEAGDRVCCQVQVGQSLTKGLTRFDNVLTIV